MEWLANALMMGVEKVYLTGWGESKLIPVKGAVVRYLDDEIFVGGQINEQPARGRNVDALLMLKNGTSIKLIGLDNEFIDDGNDTYYNGRSKAGTRVLYIAREDAEVRVDLGRTL